MNIPCSNSRHERKVNAHLIFFCATLFLLNRSSTKVINMKHQLFVLPRFEGPSLQELQQLKKFDGIRVVEYAEEIKELFEKILTAS